MCGFLINNRFITLTIILSGLVFLISCTKPAKDNNSDISLSLDTVLSNPTGSLDDYLKDIQLKLENYISDFEQLKQEAKKQNLDKSAHFSQELEILELKYKDVKLKLVEYNNTTGGKLDEIKPGMDEDLMELDNMLQSVKSHFE